MRYQPELFKIFKEKEPTNYVKDILAGVIVGIIAIPLSIALAIASGASPKEGLLTAAIAGFFASLLGGSRVQVTGPTGAFVVIVYGIIAQYGMGGLITATILAGIILILMGILKLGSLVKFIPMPVVSGFTSGIAVVILSGQIKDLLGLQMDKVPSEFIHKCIAYAQSIGTINLWALLIALIALVIMLPAPKVSKVIPGSLIAILVTTLIVQFFKIPVDTIGSNYPDLTGSIPKPSIPMLGWEEYVKLLEPAFTIALLGAIESLLSAVVADKMTGQKHDSDTELIAQGVANVTSGLFGGLPATGAIARTAANIKNGGRTPIAGIVHALFVLFVSLLLLPLAKLIPMSALAAVLLMVCYNMFEWHEFKRMKKVPKSDVILMVTTFVLTIVFDLIVAIKIGLILAAILFIKRISEESRAKGVTVDQEDKVLVYNFSGPLFFGNMELFEQITNSVKDETKYIVLDMKNVNSIDLTALSAIAELIKQAKQNKQLVYLTQLQKQPLKAVRKAKLDHKDNCIVMKEIEKVYMEVLPTQTVSF